MEPRLLLRRRYMAVLLLCVLTEAQNIRPRFDSLLAFSDNANFFARDLYKSLGSRGNVVLSPMSIFTSMSMTSAGAQGQTRSQIFRALNLQSDSLTRNSPMAYVVNNLQGQDDPKVSLEMANFMWVPMGVSIKAEFARTLQDVFQTRVRSADFTRAEEVRQLVNNRISNATRGKIPHLLPTGAVTSQTRMLLANAVYFKGSWIHPFDPSKTQREPFVYDAVNSRSVLVPMMRTNDLFRGAIFDDLDAKAVFLPYESNRYGLLLLLPNRYDGIKDLENNFFRLNYTTTTLLQRMSHRDVNLTIPKFQAKFQADLSLALQRMGVTELFSDNADLTGLSSAALKHRLRASGMFHQATLDVNEGGSEASAASGLEITPLMGAFGTTGPIEFKADHPFLFFLVDEDNGNLPLFMGRMTNPASEEIQNNEVEPSRSRESLPDSPAVLLVNRNRPSSNGPKLFPAPGRPFRTNFDEVIFPQTRSEPFFNFQRIFSIPPMPQTFRRNPQTQNRLVSIDDLFFSPSAHQVHSPVVFPDEEEDQDSFSRKTRQTSIPPSSTTTEESIELRGDKFWFKKPTIPDLLIPVNQSAIPSSSAGAAPQAGGVVPQTGGVAAQAGGVALQSGGVAPQTGGVAAQAGGVALQSGGVAPQSGGVAPHVAGSLLQPSRTPQNEVNIFGGSGWSESSVAGPPHLVSSSSLSPADVPLYLLLPFPDYDFPLPLPGFPQFPQAPNLNGVVPNPIAFPGLVNRITEALRNKA